MALKTFAKTWPAGLLILNVLNPIPSFGEVADESAIRCRSAYQAERNAVVFSNRGLDLPGGTLSERDCASLVEEIVSRGELPIINGDAVAAHLVYDLPNRELFPMVRRFLDAAQNRKLKVGIHFSLPEGEVDPEEPTSIEVHAGVRN